MGSTLVQSNRKQVILIMIGCQDGPPDSRGRGTRYNKEGKVIHGPAVKDLPILKPFKGS